MTRFITPPDAAIFTGLLGIIMVLAGREISGAIVIGASLGAFVFFEWYLYSRKTGIDYSTNRGIRKHNAMYPDDPIPLLRQQDETRLLERLLRLFKSR